jgi:hypothetical protein
MNVVTVANEVRDQALAVGVGPGTDSSFFGSCNGAIRAVLLSKDGSAEFGPKVIDARAASSSCAQGSCLDTCMAGPVLAAPDGDGYLLSWIGDGGRVVRRLDGDGIWNSAETPVPSSVAEQVQRAFADGMPVQLASADGNYLWLTSDAIITTSSSGAVLDTEALPAGRSMLVPERDPTTVLTSRVTGLPARMALEGRHFEGRVCVPSSTRGDAAPKAVSSAGCSPSSGPPDAGTSDGGVDETAARASDGCSCRAAGGSRIGDARMSGLALGAAMIQVVRARRRSKGRRRTRVGGGRRGAELP